VQERDVERATAEIVDGDPAVVGQAHGTIGQRRGGRLVDDAQDVEPGDAAGVARGLALAVVEVGGTVITASVTVSPR